MKISMELSASTVRALEILKDNRDGLNPSFFAELMWPDSPSWRKEQQTGTGVVPGGSMSRAAGGFLGKLAKRGLVLNLSGRGNLWVIRGAGVDALEAHRDLMEKKNGKS